jgi:hypothetical protein
MPKHTPARRAARTAATLTEMGLAAPQVVAHRLTRMALSGHTPNARDRQEFTGMVAEKQLAFFRAWMAMLTETLRWQQSFMLSLMAGASLGQHRARAHGAASRMADAMIGPYHRKAVANAKRLARTPLR